MLSLAEQGPNQIQQFSAALVGRLIESPIRIKGGANNQIHKITANGTSYALKLYINGIGDKRDRLGTEFRALQFLSDNGVASVPTPLAIDRDNNLALFQWIEGSQIGHVTDSDITAAIDFVRTLHDLRKVDGAANLPPASETCLSPAEIVQQIVSRLETLQEVAQEEPQLEVLLGGRIYPVIQKAISLAHEFCEKSGQAFETEIAPEYRTLSPSDFGFHNARRDLNGRIVFVDFEYFGWDEPAKLGAEFVIHPGMTLSEDQKYHFIAGVDAIYRDDPGYHDRVRALFPLYALRWCMIALNEFLPDRWSRRLLAHETLDRAVTLDEQLNKAYRLLDIAEKGIEGFPYGS